MSGGRAAVNVAVGQEVAIRSAYGHNDYTFGWTVTRVTATGQIVVQKDERARRFDSSGYEMGRSGSYVDRLDPCVAGAREQVAHQQRCIAAGGALAAVHCDGQVRWTWGKEAMQREVQRLEESLAAARAAVEAI